MTSPAMPARRVVITGLGLVTPLGLGVEPNWKAILEGRSAISQITRFDPARFSTRIAGEIKQFDVQQFIDRKEARKMDLFIQYAITAAELAVQDAGLDPALLAGERTGVYVGSGIGGIGSIEETHRILLEKGPERVSPFSSFRRSSMKLPVIFPSAIGRAAPTWPTPRPAALEPMPSASPSG